MGRESRFNPNRPTLGPSYGGPIRILDALGRELREGDLLTVNHSPVVAFEVASIKPMLDPGAPPNLVEVIVRVHLRFGAANNQPSQEFVRVMPREENPQWQRRQINAQDGQTTEPPTPAEEKADRPPLEIIRTPMEEEPGDRDIEQIEGGKS